jgi:hypothetical protein
LEKAISILPLSDEEVIFKGIAAGISERIMALKKTKSHLIGKYNSLENLEAKIKREGISPDDHTLYTDLLEWKAINHELVELLQLFESL